MISTSGICFSAGLFQYPYLHYGYPLSTVSPVQISLPMAPADIFCQARRGQSILISKPDFYDEYPHLYR